VLLKNIKGVNFPGRFLAIQQVESVLSCQSDHAYTLSLLLLISSQLGEISLYHKVLNQFQSAMVGYAHDSFSLWLYGRALFSAMSCQDERNIREIKDRVRLLLETSTKKENLDKYTLWGLCYASLVDQELYESYKNLMLKSSHHLSKDYLDYFPQIKQSLHAENNLSDILWIWIMMLYAASHNKDKTFYEDSLGQILQVTQTKAIGDALLTGLETTQTSNDYPAWALSIVRLGTQAMQDNALFDELEELLEAFLEKTLSLNQMIESCLVRVNMQIIVERSKKA
jgi:hypothetical protein